MGFNEVRTERACNIWKRVTSTLALAGRTAAAAEASVSMETVMVTRGQHIATCEVCNL
jgi:hypothetical protein